MMVKKVIFLSLSIIIFITMIIKPCSAQERDIKEIVSNFVDLTSLSNDYKIYQAISDLKSYYKIVFMNTKNRQRMSLTTYKKNRALSNGELEKFLKNTLTNLQQADASGFKNENISIKNFMIDRQHIPYFIMDQYSNNELIDKAMIGVIPNCNGYFIVIQAYSDYQNYSQALTEEFFKNIKINTRNMY